MNFGAIPGATGPALRISGIAAAGRTQVAVGTANGYPAIWSSVERRCRALESWVTSATSPRSERSSPVFTSIDVITNS